MTLERVPFAFYNLAPVSKPNRDPARVALELNAIANNQNHDRRRAAPKLIGWCEGIHRPIPDLEHYRSIRSTTNLSRANIGLYVRNGMEVEDIEWVQHEKTWARTEDAPPHGTHEARATLKVMLKDDGKRTLAVVGHAPPKTRSGPRSSHEARQEWVDVMDDILSTAPHAILLSDPNDLTDQLLKRLPATTVASEGNIEAVLCRGYTIGSTVRTVESVNKVRMLSDHRHALVGRATRRP